MGSLWSTRVVRRPGRTVLEHWDVRHRIIQHGHGAHCDRWPHPTHQRNNTPAKGVMPPCHEHEYHQTPREKHQDERAASTVQNHYCYLIDSMLIVVIINIIFTLRIHDTGWGQTVDSQMCSALKEGKQLDPCIVHDVLNFRNWGESLWGISGPKSCWLSY